MNTSRLELSIIVPVLNDTAEVRGLLSCLAEQTRIGFEVILCDGGSTDGLQEMVAERTILSSFSLKVIATPRGRGTQMNAGADIAVSDLLLFVHADSRFTCSNALHSGVFAYKTSQKSTSRLCAGRFRLHFRHSDPSSSPAYFYHEAKARLNRSSCIRGDQGFLIYRRSFEQLGRFDTSLPFLEDVRLAALLDNKGEWLLLPADIYTSARRFEQEGFYERQVANVIIVNAVETGWNELLAALPELYRCSGTAGRLSLFPLLDGVRTMIHTHDRTWRKSFWRATGDHVAANAWQIFFWLDVRHALRYGHRPDDVDPVWLTRYERFVKPLIETRPAAWLAKLLTRVWLRWMLHTNRKEPA
jgi:rSAM/selenodomain-associated transferase 2